MSHCKRLSPRCQRCVSTYSSTIFRGRSGAYTNVQSVEVVDPHTVAFHLKTPSASFPINLVMGIVKSVTGSYVLGFVLLSSVAGICLTVLARTTAPRHELRRDGS